MPLQARCASERVHQDCDTLARASCLYLVGSLVLRQDPARDLRVIAESVARHSTRLPRRSIQFRSTCCGPECSNACG